jgi:hypothetical protein
MIKYILKIVSINFILTICRFSYSSAIKHPSQPHTKVAIMNNEKPKVVFVLGGKKIFKYNSKCYAEDA